ncbi:MAG: hypothetical protein V4787_24635 [Pseudomonadota bacterium]
MDSLPQNHAVSMHPGDADVLMGVKRITVANLALSDSGRHFGMDETQWVEWFSEASLKTEVPEPVRRLFEVARGAMIYGWYYYPLLALGSDECIRCLEAGARHAAWIAKLHAEPDKQVKVPFHTVIRSLVQAGLIMATDADQWEAGRILRNAAAHPTTPTLLLPGQARAMLSVTGGKLDRLFSRVVALPSLG